MFRFGSTDYDREYQRIIETRKENETPPFILTSPEWLSEYVDLIREDEKYKRVARSWEGSCVLVFEADEKTVYRRSIYIFLDLWHGECRSGRLVPPGEGLKGDFVLYSSYERWKMIIKKELNVVKAIATGKLRLYPFDVKKAARLAAASQAAIRLVELVREGGCVFPDETEEARRGSYREVMEELFQRFGI